MSLARTLRLLGLLALLIAVAAAGHSNFGSAHAQTGVYALTWYSIDGGGAATSVTPNGYTLSGTIGQTDTGVHSGASYMLTDGFWAGIDPRYLGYAPRVER